MRVLVLGGGAVAKSLRTLVALDPVLLPGRRAGHATVNVVEDRTIDHPFVDGVDSPLELAIFQHLAEAGPVTADPRRDRLPAHNAMTVRVPAPLLEEASVKVEQAIYRGLLDAARPPQHTRWYHLKKFLGVATLLLGLVAPASAQIVGVRDSTTGLVVPNIGDATNEALRVNVVAGGAGGGTVDQGLGGASPWLVTGAGGTFPVTGTFWQAVQPVSGTFWQATQPVSAVSLPLPTNAAQETGGNLATLAAKDFATSAKQDAAIAYLATIDADTSALAAAVGGSATTAITIALSGPPLPRAKCNKVRLYNCSP